MPLLPDTVDGSALTGGPVPVTDYRDVLAAFPSAMQASTAAPVRDALAHALAAGFRAYQKGASYAFAQVDPTQATGSYLQGLGADRGVTSSASLTDAQYRASIFAAKAVVTPAAIVAQVNALLASVTTIQCQLCDAQLDQVFLPSVDNAFYCTVLTSGSNSTPAIDNSYPDRVYSSRPNSSPGGFRLFDDNSNVRCFLLRVPNLASVDNNQYFAWSGYTPQMFLQTRFPYAQYPFYTYLGPQAAMFSYDADAVSLYNQIVNVVNQIKAEGIRFILLVDPTLTA
jgi:hypothetical protein